MSRIQSHEELDVYRMAFDAAMRIFDISKEFPKEERYSGSLRNSVVIGEVGDMPGVCSTPNISPTTQIIKEPVFFDGSNSSFIPFCMQQYCRNLAKKAL